VTSVWRAQLSFGGAIVWLAHSASLVWRGMVYRFTCFLISYPYPLRALFAVLRRVRPIAIIGHTALVARADDVREVLERFGDFTLGEFLETRMPWGPFLMSLDWHEQHARERQFLESVVFAGDLDRVRDVATRTSNLLIAQSSGEIDVAQGLSEKVAVEIARVYFGIPVIDADQLRMASILRELASTIMVEPPTGSLRWIRSREGVADLTNHLIKTTKAERQVVIASPTPPLPEPGDSLLTRLVKQCRAGDPSWLDDGWIRRYTTGLLATGAATIVRATTHALDQLVARIEHDIAALQRVAPASAELHTARDRVEASRSALRQMVYEALRFRPVLPLLARYCPRQTIIAKGTERARMLPAGAQVIAGPLAAMFDPEAFAVPRRFCTDRCLGDYLHFGYGPRTCFGKYISDAATIEIIRSLLLLPNLRRKTGRRGRVRYDGPAACSLVVRFGQGTQTRSPK
jgi:cytochrome P450